MAEWLIVAVLKTADREFGSRVRIPESPFSNKIIWSCGRVGYATLLLQGESEKSDARVRILPRPFGRCGVIGKRIRFKPGWGIPVSVRIWSSACPLRSVWLRFCIWWNGYPEGIGEMAAPGVLSKRSVVPQ